MIDAHLRFDSGRRQEPTHGPSEAAVAVGRDHGAGTCRVGGALGGRSRRGALAAGVSGVSALRLDDEGLERDETAGAVGLGLDELDTIARTRTGYAFAELPDEIQDAILGLIATRDLTTRKLDLALWLEDLHATAVAAY